MIVILSPAKTLDFERPQGKKLSSTPVCRDDADYLAGELRKFTPSKLKALLGVSDALVKLNHERFQSWDTQEQKQCILAYMGDAYRSLQAASLSDEELDFAQDHVRILSGLYGVLRPMDLIKPYRLEMGSRLANRDGKDLYAYWRHKVTARLRSELEAAPEEERFLVNCASQEYAKAVDVKALGYPVYQMSFPGPSLFAKGARGAMVRHIIMTRVKSPEGLKSFQGNDGEWEFEDSKSSEKEFVFSRDAQKASKACKQARNGGKKAGAADPAQGKAPQKKKRKT